jgi:putative AlgH/UPF0301 family transcriptional regulator
MCSLAGAFLVARPSLSRGFFARTVILLLRHNEDGAFSYFQTSRTITLTYVVAIPSGE